MTLVMPTAAGAQGLFESLFGGGSQQSAPPQRQAPPATPLYGYRAPLYDPYRQSSPSGDPGASEARGGQFQTMCVRMCDGYYFPISHGVSRSAFHRDANRCRSSCGEEGRLFYRSNSEADAGQMVDLTGRVYGKLPNAFKYRKTLVEGCKCKPEPWSVSELERHRRYASAETTDPQKQRQRPGADPDVAERKPTDGEPIIAELSPEPSEPNDDPVQPATEPQRLVETTKPRGRRAEPRPEPRVLAPRSTHNAAFAKTFAAPQSSGLFGNGFSGGSKLRWPGD